MFADAAATGPPVRLLPVIVGFDYLAVPGNGRTGLTREPDPWNGKANRYSHFFDSAGVLFSAGKRAQALSGAPLSGTALARLRASLPADRRNGDLTYRDAFVRHVVERLVDEFEPGAPLEAYRWLIHSWEVCAEPEMCTREPGSADDGRPVANDDMRAYLREAIRQVNLRGFRTTVGYQHAETITSWGAYLTGDIGQFHYYADRPLHSVTPGQAAMIGETSSTARAPFDLEFGRMLGRWPNSLQERLEWFEYKGYREVFLWSAERRPSNRLASWTESEHRQIAAFNLGLRVLGLRNRLRTPARR
ncbi:hypothetical protein [Actinoplanes sp. NPDC049118]|uniref:hypothetical protein n=1 Tax=Actinoplanes sp. NPDC049118 TaxID=3155769 RepID=UPI003411548E